MIMARTDWNFWNYRDQDKAADMTGIDTVAAMMKIGERYGGNHDHLDAGSFQLYYKGILASDSGAYVGDDYDASHNTNYAKRTVAHNALTIYNSGETFNVLGTGTSNDGGQLFFNEAGDLAQWQTNAYKRGTVLDHEIAANNSYSYIKGDITKAYSSDKTSKVLRSMAFIPTTDDHFKAMMVIYDEVASKNSSQTKKFLLHTQKEPTVSGNTVTVENDKRIIYGSEGSNGSIQNGGRLTMKTLLPASANITKVGGDGKEFSVNGTNYPPLNNNEIYDLHEAGWGRIEVKAQSEGTETDFLNVLAVSDAGDTTALDAVLIEGDGVVGAKALNKAAIFAEGKNRISSAYFEIEGSEEALDIMVFGLEAGRWLVYEGDEEEPSMYSVSKDGGTLAFSGAATAYGLELVEDFSQILPVMEASEGASFTAAAVDAINGGNFTIQFRPTTVTQTNEKRAVSILGDAKKDFAVYKPVDSADVYVKLPGTISLLGRAHLGLGTITNKTNTLTFDSETRTLCWYVDGVKSAEKVYPEGTFNISSIPFNPWGGNVSLSMLKVYDFVFTAEDVEASLE